MTVKTASTDLIINLPAVMTAELFTNDKEFEKLYSQVKEAVDKHVPDLTTKTGRDAIASLAYKVSRTKTALVGQGKKLTEGWRDQTKKVNSACNIIEDKLDALRDEVRKPLNEWEEAETVRVETHKERLESLIALSKTGFGRSSADLRELLNDAEKTPLGSDVWQEFAPQASVARDDAIDTLKRLLVTAEKQEADAAELERLRTEAAERERIEAERLALENAEREKTAQIERERVAEENRKAELAKAAELAREQAERYAQARIEAAERAVKDAEERAAKAVIEAQEKAQHETAAELQRLADAKAAEEADQRYRDADIQHRKTTNNGIIAALIECSNITEDQACKIIINMALGLIPNVTLKY